MKCANCKKENGTLEIYNGISGHFVLCPACYDVEKKIIEMRRHARVACNVAGEEPVEHARKIREFADSLHYRMAGTAEHEATEIARQSGRLGD